nr:retrovirus-related Pol polyprotein from transposon TNT 1-94 [Tanacetum cinerariifolium]
MKPFGCLVTILNTLDHLRKFDGKADEGFLVGYSINSKAIRVYNSRTKKVEENLHVNFLEKKPNVAGSGLEWLFNIDSLRNLMNYQPVSVGNRTNVLSTSSDVLSSNEDVVSSPKDDAGKKSTVEPTYVKLGRPPGIFDDAYDDRDEGAKADYNNLKTMEPKKVTQALDDESWVEAMQEELLQFKLLNVWTLMDLPYGKRAIGTKWVYRNKIDQRGIVVRIKTRLVAQGYRQEEGIDYNEVFAPVARIEAIMLFLDYASFMDFTVYQMDVKSAFLYGTIEEDVYVTQPPSFMDPEFPNIVYKVEKALYGLHQAPRTCEKSASTLMETHKLLSKDASGTDVDVHLYRPMIGSLVYLTSSRPDIMFD